MDNVVNSPSPKNAKNFFILFLLLITLIAIPLTLSQTQIQQIITGRAWSFSKSATAACIPSGTVNISVMFKNQESNRSMLVTALDKQTAKTANLGQVGPGQTKTGAIATARTSLLSGLVEFKMSWADSPNLTESTTANYSAVSTCPQPSPTPKPTASPTPKPSASPTPKPSSSPTPKPSASPTPKPSSSPTPKPSATPTVKPSPSTKPSPSITDCPTPGTVKNIQIHCPYCTPSPNPDQ